MRELFAKLTVIFLVSLLIISINPYTVFADYCDDESHQYIIIEETPATAEQDGRITYECEICGHSFTKITFAQGHRWSEWKTEKTATCTEDGEISRYCDVDIIPHSETERTPALGHNYEITETPPNCTDQGINLYTCTRCGDSYTELFGEALGHNYEEKITKKSTCTEEGVKTFTCTNCGDEHTEAIPLLVHDFGEWQVKTEPQIGVNGEKYKQCKLCSETITSIIPALPEPVIPKKSFTAEIIITSANIIVFAIMLTILFKEFICFSIHKKKLKDKISGKNTAIEKDDGYERV